MAKPLKMLCLAAAIVLILVGTLWFLLAAPATSVDKGDDGEDSVQYLLQKQPDEVAAVEVQNTHGSYALRREGDRILLGDIPPEQLNPEYVDLLLDEASGVQYLSSVSADLSRLSDYGLSDPEATVAVTYTDGSTLRLLIGAEEPVSGGRYFMQEGAGEILLMKNSRSIRFTMPVENFIDFVIIPPEETTSPLNELQDIKFSGTSLQQPIALKAVLPERADLQLEGISYGALTHMVVQPGLHEANSTAMTKIAEDLLGLISEGIVEYNCTEQQLAAYGFDAPYLRIDFDYKNGKDAAVAAYTLRVSQLDGEYIATLNDEGIVYKILDLSFLHPSYSELSLRWFVSPFVTDVAQLTVETGAEKYTYDLAGENAKELTVSSGGAPLDSGLFKRYYNLIVSAASDGALLEKTPTLSGEPVMTLRYHYKNAQKQDDVLRFYDAGQRRLYVEVNGVCEATMRQNYAAAVEAGAKALAKGETFATEW